MAISGALAGAAGLALPLRQGSGRVVVQRGIVGGGLVEIEGSEAHFSVFASRLTFEEDKEVVVGSVFWVDTTVALKLVTTSITDYIVPDPQPGEGATRHILGTMSVNDEGEVPFELVVTDAGVPGSGQDLVQLRVGDGVQVGDSATPASGFGFTYVAVGPVVAGDIQEVDLKFDPTTGIVQPAED